MTPEQQEAMRRGREKALKKRRKEAHERVKAYRAWLAADAEYSRKFNERVAAGESTATLGSRPRMPHVTDSDYHLAREAGLI